MPGCGIGLTLNDGLVGLHTALHVVGLDGQDLLQSVSSAVSFQCPDFHFAKALAAELGLAAQRLLSDQRVGAGRTCMDLIIDQVMQLQVVHITDGNAVIELFAGAAIVNGGLAIAVQLDLGEVDDVTLLAHDLGELGGICREHSHHATSRGRYQRYRRCRSHERNRRRGVMTLMPHALAA